MSTPTTARCQKSWHAEHGQRAVDGEQQVGADRGAPHGAAAAEDRDAADDGRADGVELEAGAGLRVDRAVAGRVEHAREAGECAADHEGRQHALGDLEAVEVGGSRVGADRVELAAAAVVAHVPAGEHQHDEGDDREDRDERGASSVPSARKSFGMSEALMRSLPVHSTLMPR